MAHFLMLMMDGKSVGDWEAYIQELIADGKLRGGSSLGNGLRFVNRSVSGRCQATGFIRIEATTMEEAVALLKGNPAYEGGGVVELLEEIPD